MPRLTTAWLRSRGACEPGMDAWLAGPYAATGCCLADAVDVARGESAWLRWLYRWMAEDLPVPVLRGLAASRARSVEHMWPEERREACARAVALAEAVADGQPVSRRGYDEACLAMFGVGAVMDLHDQAAYVARVALWAAEPVAPDRPRVDFLAMDAASVAARARQDEAQGWREALAELDAALSRAGVPA